MLNALFYVRPWTDAMFRCMAARSAVVGRSVFMSDHEGVDTSGFVEDMKRAYGNGSGRALPGTTIDLEDVIIRDRLLRSLDRTEAVRLVTAAYEATMGLFDRARPGVVISLTVDFYINDMLERIASSRGIPYVGLVSSFVNGYWRPTRRGEYLRLRSVADEEVRRVRDELLRTSYRPQFLASGHPSTRMVKQFGKEAAKYVVFSIRKRREPLNYFYHISQQIAGEVISLSNLSAPRFFDGRWQALAASGRPVAYLPLQFTPEATVDYWVADTAWIDYEARILEVVSKLSDTHAVLIKEHPMMVGRRNVEFYRELRRIPKVSLVPPSEASNAVLEKADLVVVTTGSVGFEARLRGIATVALGKPYYATPEHFAMPENGDLGAAVIDAIEKAAQTGDEHSQQLTRYALEGALPGRIVLSGFGPADVASVEAITAQIDQLLLDEIV